MKKWIFLVVFILIASILAFGPLSPLTNQFTGSIYLKLFEKKGDNVADISSISVSKNKPYILIGDGSQYSQDYTLKLINTSTDQIEKISENVGQISNYPFSPDGKRFVYPVIRKDKVFVSDTNTKFYYYYDLYLYDISSNTKVLITQDVNNNLLNTYDKTIYGWVDDSNIAYICDERRIYSPTKGCAYNLNTRQTISVNTPLNIKDPKVNNPNIPTASDFSNCFNNFDGSMCAYSNLRFRIWDGMLFQEIWLKKNGEEVGMWKDVLIYRDRPRVGQLYWTYDNHLYGVSVNRLVKLY